MGTLLPHFLLTLCEHFFRRRADINLKTGNPYCVMPLLNGVTCNRRLADTVNEWQQKTEKDGSRLILLPFSHLPRSQSVFAVLLFSIGRSMGGIPFSRFQKIPFSKRGIAIRSFHMVVPSVILPVSFRANPACTIKNISWTWRAECFSLIYI